MLEGENLVEEYNCVGRRETDIDPSGQIFGPEKKEDSDDQSPDLEHKQLLLSVLQGSVSLFNRFERFGGRESRQT
jgi:hypothetical protein